MGLQVSSGLDFEMPEKVLFGDLRKYLGEVFRELALQKESKVLIHHRNPFPLSKGFYDGLNAVLTIRPVSVTKISVVGCRSMIAV